MWMDYMLFDGNAVIQGRYLLMVKDWYAKTGCYLGKVGTELRVMYGTWLSWAELG